MKPCWAKNGYQVIYADPPWRYSAYSGRAKGSAESHSPTMDPAALRALPVGALAHEDCALFLWVTMPCLQEGLLLLEAWGFSYKTGAFVWVKQNRRADSLFMGLGSWTRSNAELCLLAVRGRPRRRDAGVRQIILSHVGEHSRKPEAARERILQLMGDVPRIELFARERAEGWDVWGNEVESDISMPESRNGG